MALSYISLAKAPIRSGTPARATSRRPAPENPDLGARAPPLATNTAGARDPALKDAADTARSAKLHGQLGDGVGHAKEDQVLARAGVHAQVVVLSLDRPDLRAAQPHGLFARNKAELPGRRRAESEAVEPLNAQSLALSAYEASRPTKEDACRIGDPRLLGARER